MQSARLKWLFLIACWLLFLRGDTAPALSMPNCGDTAPALSMSSCQHPNSQTAPAPTSSGDAYFPSPSDHQDPQAATAVVKAKPRSGSTAANIPDREKPKNRDGAGTAFEPGEVVAIVGGEPILVGDMLLEVNQVLNQHLAHAPPEVRDRERRNVVRAMANRFIDAELLYLDGISGLPDAVDLESVLKQAEDDFDSQALPKLLERMKLPNAQAYDAQLRGLGSSLRQYRSAWARQQLAAHLVRDKLKIDEDLSHAELLDHYRGNIDSFAHPARVRWEELMVRLDRFPSRETARAKIVSLGNEVVYGASFAAVARESSQGFTASAGGVYDWISRGSLANPEIETALFDLPEDYLSDVIETRHGFHIVRVIKREEAWTTPFRDAQPEIREKLLDERREKAIEAHLTELRRKIPHEIVFDP